MKNISMEKLLGMRLALPSPFQQFRFAELIKEVREISSVSAGHEGFSTLTASLLAHSFTGELTAEWRERHRAKLEREATARDEDLKASGLGPSRTAMIQEIEAMSARRTDGAFAELTREQWVLYEAIERTYGGVVYARWFTAEEVAGNLLIGPLRGNRQAVEGHLAVLAARGLVIPVSRQEELGSTGEIVYGNAYRLRLRDFEPQEGDPQEPIEGDDARLREMTRLVGQLEKEWTP